MYPITTFLGSILALGSIYLSLRVIQLRHKHQVAVGHGEYRDLEKAIRAHGNFFEYVPMTLILMLCAEANQAPTITLLVLAALFLLGRVFHAYAFLGHHQHFTFRKNGMRLTFTSIGLLAILNLGLFFFSMTK